MKTSQRITFVVHTVVFSVSVFQNNLRVIRQGNNHLVGEYNMATDPLDYVVDDVVMVFVELCPVEIEKDQEVLELTEEVFTCLQMFYHLYDLERARAKKNVEEQ